jgi:hypothetical protein
MNWLGLQDFVGQKPGSALEARVYFGDQATVNAEFKYDEFAFHDLWKGVQNGPP